MNRDDPLDPVEALVELRARLEAARINSGLDKTALARRACLGRTVVSQALSKSAPAPSAQTVGALARAVGLARETRSLLELLARASGPAKSARSRLLGRSIMDWDPHDLEVHPAVDVVRNAEIDESACGPERDCRGAKLPEYVRRSHDAQLAAVVADAASGNSRMTVLVGSSSTGKTRACWEAVQPLAHQGWLLWHPISPTHADAVLADIEDIAPRTVIWLNEAQNYLGAGAGVGERIAAALRCLLADPERTPVLVLGTLWPHFATVYTARPERDEDDQHRQARELLAGRRITLPDSFDEAAVDCARALAAAGDLQLAKALEQSSDGRLTQYLAGAPELLHRYETASPPARALLNVAMDARRLGAAHHLPLTFLKQAAADYLTDDENDTLTDNWFEEALADTAAAVHGNLAPLRPVRPRTTRQSSERTEPAEVACRLADYLEQHGRQKRQQRCPPTSFWQAVHDRITHTDSLVALADAAQRRHRTYWAHRLTLQAARAGHSRALSQLVHELKDAKDWEGARALYLQAANSGAKDALLQLCRVVAAYGNYEVAEDLYRQSAQAGDPRALLDLAREREFARQPGEAEEFYWQAAQAGVPGALTELARIRERSGQREEAEELCWQAAQAGDAGGLLWLLDHRQREGSGAYGIWYGDRDGQSQARRRQREYEDLYLRVVDFGNPRILARLAENSRREEFERLARLVADAGDVEVLRDMQFRRELHGRTGSEYVAGLIAEAGDCSVQLRLARKREEAKDEEGAERLARLALDAGNTEAVRTRARNWAWSGDHERAERLARMAAVAGDLESLLLLAHLAGQAGHTMEAERLARFAADTGALEGTTYLARLARDSHEWEKAERFAQQAAETGEPGELVNLAWARYGDSPEEAECLAQQAAEAGAPHVLVEFAGIRERAGEDEKAERLAQQAADAGDCSALVLRKDVAGGRQEAERLARQAAAAGDFKGLLLLARRRADAGDWQEAERLAQEAADAGDASALRDLGIRCHSAGDYKKASDLHRRADEAALPSPVKLVLRREDAGDWEEAERLAQQLADSGNPQGLLNLARRRRQTARPDEAEALYRRAAEGADFKLLASLAEARFFRIVDACVAHGRELSARDVQEVKDLYRRCADAGGAMRDDLRRHMATYWPNGLDPDGTPSEPWSRRPNFPSHPIA